MEGSLGRPKKTFFGIGFCLYSSSQLGLVVSNYGDCKSPRPGVVGPLKPWPMPMAGILTTYWAGPLSLSVAESSNF